MTKRDDLIKTAFELFYQHGVHSVGINQILAETGVAKKTLYSHFASKEALLEAVIAYRDERFRLWLFGLMDAHTDPEEVVQAMFDGLDDWFNDRVDVLMPFQGCFFVKVNAEFLQHRVNELCFEHKQAIVDYLVRRLSQHYAAEAAQRLASQLALLKEGAIAQAYLGKDRQAAQVAWRLAQGLLSTGR
ncbi:putative HTH-type transcriptional regulator YxaF [Marinomonas aquimarina]|uniref:Putative HTH-type transcriptional regulator YxaF n=1 Tax=Marinomonas aquimarina TaxID=295068 RepID=A0A1A8TIR1_9GAMM|nr:TetR/AcrR family transcriptional regulator [Marinomonas aquimarina]SBS32660.1 putative HTH-type transcriptional regulator YxaF [Marinomonas aquimarina]